MGGKGPPRPSSSESDDWGDESWIVDCPCGVNYDDGEEMVECDECGVWVHTACCRVTKGLPTFVCDKCKIKKKLKESEDLEVAQLLADLPSKPVSFEQDRNPHEKPETYITEHHNSSEIPIEERVYVHGIPGGDPAFFAGAPEVFCRQLWKYTGYVPKLLKLEYKELPEPQVDVLELLRGLKEFKEFDAPMPTNDDEKFALGAQENGHATVEPMAVEVSNSREELEESKEEVEVIEEAPKDKQGKSLQARKGEAKHSKNRHKPKVKEEKPHHNGKRARDEGGLKEQSNKKKPRSNGDVCKPEDGGDSRKLEVAPAQETGALRSPLSSPKNPKAMKKLAVQEFMDGDVILCRGCGKFEPLLEPTTGASTGGGSDSLCQECEILLRHKSSLSPKQETRSMKQESVVLPVPSALDRGVTFEAKAVSKRKLDYSEPGTEAVRSRAEDNQASPGENRPDKLWKIKACNDSSTEPKKVDAEVPANLHKVSGILENPKEGDEKMKTSDKVEANTLIANHPPVDFKIWESPEAPELPAVGTVVAAKSPGESAARAEDLRQDGAQVASRPSCADDAETRTAGDAIHAICGNKKAVSVEGPLPVSSLDNSSKPVQLPPESSMVPVVPSSPGPVQAEPADGNVISGTILQDKVLPPVVSGMLEDRASKMSASTVSTETKGQGSARTAGHLPASVRGKMHGDRCNPYLQRLVSSAVAQQQASSQSGLPLVQFSVCGTPRAVHNSVMLAGPPPMKGISGDDSLSGKQHGQVQQDCISPVQQLSKQGQASRLNVASTTAAQKLPAGLSETLSPSQPSSVLRIDSDQQPSSKVQAGGELSHNESCLLAASPREPKVSSGFNSDVQVPKPTPSPQVTSTPVFCQQARQLNGIGHVYVSRKHRENHISKDPSGTLTSQALNTTVSNTKISVSYLKSPSSGTSSSSPTSPLVTTPSSKPQPNVKVSESLPTQKSVSGASTANASGPQSSSKLSGTLTPNVSSSKQVGALQSSKSTPLPVSPQSTKVVSMSKQSSRSNSLPVTKPVDGSNSVAKGSGTVSSRGLNHGGSSASASAKENAKNMTHSSSKSASKVNAQPSGTKPPSSGKSSHSLVPTKTPLSKQHSGPGSGTSKASSTPSSTKHTASHHSKCHKDDKLSMPSAPPVPKAMSTMPPPAPQVSTRRSPPTVLTSAVATTLKDEELALLLHQELNSSPRVPRVPRVRQAGASLQLVSSPSLSSAKGPFVSAASGGPSHKDHYLAPRKRTREDRHKDTSKEEVGRNGGKRSEENRMDDENVSTERSGRNGSIDGSTIKEKSGSVEGNARHYGFAKGNLSIIVPGNDEGQDGDKKSPAHSNFLTLPVLIDEVLSSRDHHVSYDDVCEAVLPHWPKLRKPNGERYAYASHRLAVLDCLRNRPAWAHLVGRSRGSKTHPGRKRRRNEIKSLSDSDDEDEHLSFRDSDELDTGKSFKRRKESDGEKRAGDASEDARKGGRQVRRRRRVEIEDGTDGEDEPVKVTKKPSGGKPEVSKSDDGTSQEEEPEAESSPSSEDEASNYSTDDEEMVVHRGIRNRRRPTDESSSSEDDID